MNKHSSIKSKGSLIERASELYDFGAAFRNGSGNAPEQVGEGEPAVDAIAEAAVPKPPATVVPHQQATFAAIDRARLASCNLIVPDGPVTGLSEEFRIVKRQLLLAARGGKGVDAVPHGERILVCSANPDEGKTYCAINLALSMASEDRTVLHRGRVVARTTTTRSLLA